MANVLQYLIHSAERVPDKCAVTDDLRSFTYAEFYHLTRAIGSGLLLLTRPRKDGVLLFRAEYGAAREPAAANRPNPGPGGDRHL